MKERTYLEKRGKVGGQVLSHKNRAKVASRDMGSISWFGLGTVACVDKNINANKYTDILKDNLWPVVAQPFPGGGYIFQNDNAPVHCARSTV